jgi:hypothetical protein
VNGVVVDVLSRKIRKKYAKTYLSASEPAIHKDVRNCNLTLTS